LGGIPSYAADAWALGCVTYQCLSGRPPFLEADDAATRHRIVSFNDDANNNHESSSSPNQVDALFEDKHASAVEASARDMIRALLQRHPTQRPDMQQVAELLFFTEANIDVFSLHRQPPYPLDVGTVAPAPEAQWSRRQYSSIWAPQPVAYDIALPDSDHQYSDDLSRSLGRGGQGATSYSTPIPEGEEGTCFFSATAGVSAVSVGSTPVTRQHKLVLGQITEQQD
jgi:serine/threonine protein kinase